MTFRSLLFQPAGGDPPADTVRPPACFEDLRLDQVVAAATATAGRTDLASYFHVPLRDTGAVAYRQAVFVDLAQPAVLAAVRRFAGTMARMRDDQHHARWAGHRLEEQRWLLAARARYCAAVTGLAADLAAADPAPCSEAFLVLREWLAGQVATGPFARLAADTERVTTALAAVTYRLEIAGTRIRVSRFPGTAGRDEPTRQEADYGSEVRAFFERFRQGPARELAFEREDDGAMSPLEAEVAERVARLFPDAFGPLATYCSEHLDYLDPTVVRLDRELAFCLAWLELADSLAGLGLRFSLPEVTDDPAVAPVRARGLFDLALATARARDGATVVTNDLDIWPGERLVVVSGPNQGGKTTFARAVGQLHYLAALGLPVPGTAVRVGLVDAIHTHFERPEDIRTLTGKLEEELLRIRSILASATPASLIVLNESFASTSLVDALEIGNDVLARIRERGALGVFVTFLDELAAGPGVVSLTSTVDAADPAIRTFRIVRRAADGRAYADALARKHHLTDPEIRARLGATPGPGPG